MGTKIYSHFGGIFTQMVTGICFHDIPNLEGVFLLLKNANMLGSGFILWKFQYFRMSIFVK